jgi:hypothetical protein
MTRNLFFCEKWAASFPAGWSTFAKNCTCSPISLGQDLTAKNAKFYFIFLFGLLELEMVVLNVF